MLRKTCVIYAIALAVVCVDAYATVCANLSYGEECREWYGFDLTGWDVQPQYAKSVCGTNAFSGANGFQYRNNDYAYDDGCFCNLINDPHMAFYWGVGCFCEDGYYNDSDSSTSCEKCPSSYPLSDGFRLNPDGSGYASNWSNGTDPCYRMIDLSGDHVTLNVQEYIYGEVNTVSLSCDGGYYYPQDFSGSGGWYMEDLYDGGKLIFSCNQVGSEYYSIDNNKRMHCPTYVGPDGMAAYGQTVGYGNGADAITDCAIPESVKFTDASGTWVYAGGCNYSK